MAKGFDSSRAVHAVGAPTMKPAEMIIKREISFKVKMSLPRKFTYAPSHPRFPGISPFSFIFFKTSPCKPVFLDK